MNAKHRAAMQLLLVFVIPENFFGGVSSLVDSVAVLAKICEGFEAAEELNNQSFGQFWRVLA